MKTRIVPIGNSQGIRIPKLLINEAGLTGEVEIAVHGNTLVIQQAQTPQRSLAERAQNGLGLGYAEMARDEEREREALEWSEATLGEGANETIGRRIPQKSAFL